MSTKIIALFALMALAAGQRPGFAGSRPIGFPEVARPTTTPGPGLSDRFGEDDVTTQRLPIEAKGDRDLVDRLSKLPVDKQPFWFINWQALEANRKNPQTYPQKPSSFVDPIPNPSPTNNNSAGVPNLNIPSPGPTNNNSGRVPNLNSLNSKESAVKTDVTAPSIQPNEPPKTNSTTEIKSRFSETESNSKNSYVSENGPSGSSSTSTVIPPSYIPSVRLPTHIPFKPNWQKSRFIPRNPTID